MSVLEVVRHLETPGLSPGDLYYGTFEEHRAIGVSPGRLESGL